MKKDKNIIPNETHEEDVEAFNKFMITLLDTEKTSEPVFRLFYYIFNNHVVRRQAKASNSIGEKDNNNKSLIMALSEISDNGLSIQRLEEKVREQDTYANTIDLQLDEAIDLLDDKDAEIKQLKRIIEGMKNI